MRLFLLGAFLLVASSKSYSQGLPLQQSSLGVGRTLLVTMKSLRDSYRPLLVFASSDTSAQLARQLKLLAAGASELRERQVLIVPVTGASDASLAASLGAGDSKALEAGYLLPREAEAVRRRFHAAENGFTVVLVGKDGGEKFRVHSPVTIERLDAVIDAMPMRQQEVRNGHAD